MDTAAYIRQVVAQAPPLTVEQMARIGSLLGCDVVSEPMVVSLDD